MLAVRVGASIGPSRRFEFRPGTPDNEPVLQDSKQEHTLPAFHNSNPDGDVKLAKRGDQSALERLLVRHLRGLEPWIASKIEPRYQAVLTAEDVLSQTGIDVFLGIGLLDADDERGFVAWLKKIALHNLIEGKRQLDARKRPPPGGQIHPPAAQSTQTLLDAIFGVESRTPSRALAEREGQERLNDAIDQLPPHYQQVVRMMDLQGLSAGEVAEKLVRTEGAILMIHARAHKRLRAILLEKMNNSAGPA